MADDGLIARLKKWLAVWTGERVRAITSGSLLEALRPKVNAWRIKLGMTTLSGESARGKTSIKSIASEICILRCVAIRGSR